MAQCRACKQNENSRNGCVDNKQTQRQSLIPRAWLSVEQS